MLLTGQGVKVDHRKGAALLIGNGLNGSNGCNGLNGQLPASAALAALCYIEARGVKRDEERGLQLYCNATGFRFAK